VLRLPEGISALLFDLDGVLTQTSKVHAKAWAQMFDEVLAARGQPPFDPVHDYAEFVDGKPRLDGVRSFLASRSIELPEGRPEDPASAETVHGLGRRKNDLVLRAIHEDGVEPYEGSVRFARAAHDAGVPMAVVSASANAKDVLAAAGLADLADTVVDGHAVEDEGLNGKPAPDTFLEGARRLGVPPARAAVFEDALAGVEAGRAGRFGWVVGVDRIGQADALAAHGADVVVQDLSELLGEGAA
jgi:beta-phosphoglucomutase family hydrolase